MRSAKAYLVVFFFVTLGAFIAAFGPSKLGGPTTVLVTQGNSMEPSFHSGDLAVVRRAPIYNVGDIVAYHLTSESVVLHRITAADNGNFVMKGDNNQWVDSTEPSGGDVVGKLWLHIPKAGGLLLQLHTPWGVGLAALAIVFTLMAGSRKPRRTARRRRVRAMEGSSRLTRPLDASILEEALGLVLTVALLALIATTFAFTQPTRHSVSGGISYTQGGSFSYSGVASPGSIYADDAVTTGEPIYLQLVRNVPVEFDYHFSSEHPHEIGGTYKLLLSVGQDTGWERTVELVPDTAFQGDSVSIRGVVPLDQVKSLVDIFSRQTGLKGGYYTVAITPTVTTEGTLDGSPYSSTYEPALKLRMDNYQLVLDKSPDKSDPLRPLESGMQQQTQMGPNGFPLLGHSIPVGTVRFGGLFVLIVSGAIALVLIGLISKARADGEPSLIEARYRSLLVNVRLDRHREVEQGQIIYVERIEDLARMATQTGRMILHEQDGANHIYTVTDRTNIYRYSPDVTVRGRIWAQSTA
jgi:signal peptidase I